MATELLLHEKISLATPEETSLGFRSQSSMPGHGDEKSADCEPPDPLSESGKAPQKERSIAEFPLDSSLSAPASDGETAPPQA